MKMRTKPRPEETVGTADVEEDAGSEQTEPWTYGRTLRARAVTVSICVAAVLWPVTVAGVGVVVAIDASQDGPAIVEEEPASAAEQSLGSVAQNYVAAWLAADRQDTTDLDRYISTGDLRLPKTASDSRNLSAANVEAIGEGTYQVAVTAEVKTSKSWGPHTYQVVLRTVGGTGIDVLGLPREVAELEVSGKKIGGYSSDVTTVDAVTDTVSGFLNAYLSGTGDLSRFTAPGTELQPISPAPHQKISLAYVVANREAPEKTADGEEIHVNARVKLQTNKETTLTADYQLTLTARAGRWEVSHLGPDKTIATAQSAR